MPTVSIIIPCYNEEKTIGMLLVAIHQQTYPMAEMEVIISDGMSEDGTRAEIEKFRFNSSGFANSNCRQSTAKHPDRLEFSD